MDENLIKEIMDAERSGWKLCVGCSKYFFDSEDCKYCDIETRKYYGLPPKEEK